MGVKEEEALTFARKIVMFNSETIFYIKNSLMLMTPAILKELNDEYEKYTILIRSKYPRVRVETILANVKNNNNHDLLKLDVDLVYDILMEELDESGN